MTFHDDLVDNRSTNGLSARIKKLQNIRLPLSAYASAGKGYRCGIRLRPRSGATAHTAKVSS